jgi:hypothetical protein
MAILKAQTVEVWRDGEPVESIDCRRFVVRYHTDGTARIVIPKGTHIELTSEDELRFHPRELRRLCPPQKKNGG